MTLTSVASALFRNLPRGNVVRAVRSSSKFSTEAESHLPKLTLFTKEECQLCDEAKDQLRPHWHRFQFVEVDITLPENEKWFELYRYEIPVFYLDEKFLCKNRIDLDKLEEKLGEKGV